MTGRHPILTPDTRETLPALRPPTRALVEATARSVRDPAGGIARLREIAADLENLLRSESGALALLAAEMERFAALRTSAPRTGDGPTSKQAALLRKLGTDPAKCASTREASAAISRLLAEKGGGA